MRQRAELLIRVRQFFREREVLEVDTPVALQFPNAAPHVANLATSVERAGTPVPYYLRASPEHAMKRLLAAGSGSIYQIGKVFRDGEAGRRHNPEFTILEWYRVGWDHRRLMNELTELTLLVMPGICVREMSLREAFQEWASVDPWTADLEIMRSAAAGATGMPGISLTFDDCFDALISHAVQPGLYDAFGKDGMILHGYPASQAALARMLPNDPCTAARFEFFVGGVELANGYWELTDAKEQRARFESEKKRRKTTGERDVPVDELLLAALDTGLPECAGVALGLERLQMIVEDRHTIEDVITFPIDRA